MEAIPSQILAKILPRLAVILPGVANGWPRPATGLPKRIESAMSPWLPPSKPTLRIKAKDLRIVRGGQRVTASWHVDGEQLSVWSAYGSRAEPIGRHKDLAASPEPAISPAVRTVSPVSSKPYTREKNRVDPFAP
jgi:hypothetical protein